MRIFVFCLMFVTAASVFSQTTPAVRKVVADERYVISYQVTAKDVIFTMDDLRARELRGATGQEMPFSFFGIYVDVDRNGQVDARKDVEYGLMKNKISICTQYLLDANASTACGGFVSGAFYEKSSRLTDNAPFAHIVHRFSIPRSEITTGGQKEINVVFHCVTEGDKFWAPSAFYPARDDTAAGSISFSKTIAINLLGVDL